ncbi:hypothetical protein ACA910_021198 [Epithemia clementina (nom. ined.)]
MKERESVRRRQWTESMTTTTRNNNEPSPLCDASLPAAKESTRSSLSSSSFLYAIRRLLYSWFWCLYVCGCCCPRPTAVFGQALRQNKRRLIVQGPRPSSTSPYLAEYYYAQVASFGDPLDGGPYISDRVQTQYNLMLPPEPHSLCEYPSAYAKLNASQTAQLKAQAAVLYPASSTPIALLVGIGENEEQGGCTAEQAARVILQIQQTLVPYDNFLKLLVVYFPGLSDNNTTLITLKSDENSQDIFRQPLERALGVVYIPSRVAKAIKSRMSLVNDGADARLLLNNNYQWLFRMTLSSIPAEEMPIPAKGDDDDGDSNNNRGNNNENTITKNNNNNNDENAFKGSIFMITIILVLVVASLLLIWIAFWLHKHHYSAQARRQRRLERQHLLNEEDGPTNSSRPLISDAPRQHEQPVPQKQPQPQQERPKHCSLSLRSVSRFSPSTTSNHASNDKAVAAVAALAASAKPKHDVPDEDDYKKDKNDDNDESEADFEQDEDDDNDEETDAGRTTGSGKFKPTTCPPTLEWLSGEIDGLDEEEEDDDNNEEEEEEEEDDDDDDDDDNDDNDDDDDDAVGLVAAVGERENVLSCERN